MTTTDRAWLATGALQNVGAERMLGYGATDVVNEMTSADLSDAGELIVRAQTLSHELAEPIALVFEAARGMDAGPRSP